MPNKNNNNLRVMFDCVGETVSCTSNNYWVLQSRNLSMLAESLVSSGEKPIISYIKVITRAAVPVGSDSDFTYHPIVVQTAGTFTDTSSRTESTITELLDQAIDDEHGHLRIGGMRVSKKISGGSSADRQILETQFEIPKSIINLLNKEVSTERLQELYLGSVGYVVQNSITITIRNFFEVGYRLAAKGVTIR